MQTRKLLVPTRSKRSRLIRNAIRIPEGKVCSIPLVGKPMLCNGILIAPLAQTLIGSTTLTEEGINPIFPRTCRGIRRSKALDTLLSPIGRAQVIVTALSMFRGVHINMELGSNTALERQHLCLVSSALCSPIGISPEVFAEQTHLNALGPTESRWAEVPSRPSIPPLNREGHTSIRPLMFPQLVQLRTMGQKSPFNTQPSSIAFPLPIPTWSLEVGLEATIIPPGIFPSCIGTEKLVLQLPPKARKS